MESKAAHTLYEKYKLIFEEKDVEITLFSSLSLLHHSVQKYQCTF